MSKPKVQLNPFSNRQRIVNTQTDINRAVWAANLSRVDEHSFKSESERDDYIINCLKSAQKDIETFLLENK